jgi:hypothetical protein
MGDLRFVQYSNAGIVEKDTPMPDGTVRHVRPVFDIKISAEKQSPFVRAAQNEIAKELYGMGMFSPEMELPALTALEMMDFEGKEKIKQLIQQNGMFTQQFQAAMGIIQQMAMIDPVVAQMAMQAGLIAPEQVADMQMARQEAQQQSEGKSTPGTPEQKISASGNSYADKIRERSANAAAPN